MTEDNALGMASQSIALPVRMMLDKDELKLPGALHDAGIEEERELL